MDGNREIVVEEDRELESLLSREKTDLYVDEFLMGPILDQTLSKGIYSFVRLSSHYLTLEKAKKREYYLLPIRVNQLSQNSAI